MFLQQKKRKAVCAQVAAVFEWLTDCLRDPGGTYELITPTRRPLVTSMGTVRTADLLPSVRVRVRGPG